MTIQEFVKAFIERLTQVWNDLKDLIKKLANIQEGIDAKSKLRTEWVSKKDTRLKSQVTNSKPRNLVKKIIR